MPNVIGKVQVVRDVCYTTEINPTPIRDESGEQLECGVDHKGRRILISPTVPFTRRLAAINEAIALARASFPSSAPRLIPLLGSVD